MRIYLDFDGVLHGIPLPRGALFFEQLPRFEAVLRQHPAARVVVSSAWRESFAFEDLQEFFSADLRDRIIGVTPVLPDRQRWDEVLWHMECTGYTGPFVILDDMAAQFPANCAQLILCDTAQGLTDREWALLAESLA